MFLSSFLSNIRYLNRDIKVLCWQSVLLLNVPILVPSLSSFFFGLHSFMILLLAGHGIPMAGPSHMEVTTSPVERLSIFLLVPLLSLSLCILANAGVTVQKHWLTSRKTLPMLYSELYSFGSDGLVSIYICIAFAICGVIFFFFQIDWSKLFIGFNGGSALAANLRAASACIVTNLAASVGGLTWMLWVRIYTAFPLLLIAWLFFSFLLLELYKYV